VGMSLAACNPPPPQPTPEPTSTEEPAQPTDTATPEAGNNPGSSPTPTGTSSESPTPECPTPTGTSAPMKVFIGNFNLSSYYTPVYEEQYWEGDPIYAETDPRNKSAISNGKYLARGGGYTDDKNWALSGPTGPKGFFGHGAGICTQGSGIIEGKVIKCTTAPPEVKFEWGALDNVVAYKTVARCGSSKFLEGDETIYVDATWYNDFLGDNNPEKELKVTDTGNSKKSLCKDPRRIRFILG